MEIVFGLQNIIARQIMGARHVKCGAHLARVEIGGAHRAHLALFTQLLKGAEGLFIACCRIRPMGQVEINDVDAEPAQGRVGRLFDIFRAEAFSAGAHVRAHLGDDHHAVTVAAGLHPFADDRFGFTALVAGNP